MGTLNRPKSHWCMSSRDLRWGRPTARRRRTCAWLKREAHKLRRRLNKREIAAGFSQEEPTLDEFFGVNSYIRDKEARKKDRAASYRCYFMKQLWSQLRSPVRHVVFRFDDQIDAEYDYYESEIEGYEQYKRDLEYENKRYGRHYGSLLGGDRWSDDFWDDEYDREQRRSYFDDDDDWGDDWDPFDDYPYVEDDRTSFVFRDEAIRRGRYSPTTKDLKADPYLTQDLFLGGRLPTPAEEHAPSQEEIEALYDAYYEEQDYDQGFWLDAIRDKQEEHVIDLKEFWRRNGFNT